MDKPGREPSPFPPNKSSIELGTEIQTRLAGKPVSGAIYTFAPTMEQFLKAHLFGDIFGRDNLDFQSREIATISALANMEGVNPRLRAHLIDAEYGSASKTIRCLGRMHGCGIDGKKL